MKELSDNIVVSVLSSSSSVEDRTAYLPNGGIVGSDVLLLQT